MLEATLPKQRNDSDNLAMPKSKNDGSTPNSKKSGGLFSGFTGLFKKKGTMVKNSDEETKESDNKELAKKGRVSTYKVTKPDNSAATILAVDTWDDAMDHDYIKSTKRLQTTREGNRKVMQYI